MPHTFAVLAAGCLMVAGAAATAAPYSTFTAGAAAASRAEGGEPAAPRAPYDIVGYGVNELRRFLAHDTVRNPDAIGTFLDESIAPYFDFEAMARWAAGPFYRSLSASERERFHQTVRDMCLEALARNLGSYAIAAPPVQVFPPMSRDWGDEMTVRARVFPDGGYPVTLDFRFYLRGDRWRVFDVAANGFSAVAYYRRHFASLVRAGGPATLYR